MRTMAVVSLLIAALAGPALAQAPAGTPGDIVVTRTIDAPPERVWRALTDCEQVMRWWGPNGFTSPSCRIDLKEGGRFVWHMRAPKPMGGGDFYSAGTYTRIVPGERIEFDQHLSDVDGQPVDPAVYGMTPDFPKTVTSAWVIRPVDGGTELVATERGWTPGPMHDMSEQGLKQTLDKLEKVVEAGG